MPVSSRVASRLLAALAALACPASSALAGWSADPVTVTSTTASIPIVEACADGAHGTFVAWQEGGVLRAQHLLPNGELDPMWPAGGAVGCGVPADRSDLVVLPDRLGGLYLLWNELRLVELEEQVALFATRLAPDGSVATGWPSCGRILGAIAAWEPRASIIEDGAHGFYAAWGSGAEPYYRYPAVAVHIGPNNQGAGGWPNGIQTLSPLVAEQKYALWPQLVLAPDGGVFIAWASVAATPGVPGSWILRRVTASGASAPGWTANGEVLGEFHHEYINAWLSTASLLALAEDGRGGVFLLIGNPVAPDPYGQNLEPRLFRVTGSGQSAPDWPATGVRVPFAQHSESNEFGSDGSLRVLSDHRDGALVGTLSFASDGGTSMSFWGCLPDGRATPGFSAWPPNGYEIASHEDDGIFVADFFPRGPVSPFSPYAMIHVTRFPKAGLSDFLEWHPEPALRWYGDIGLAPTEDGGAVFFWSQLRERIGLFARRFSPAGEVTWMKPRLRPLPRPGLELLRFVLGEGVRAAISVPGPAAARFELFDLAGRCLVSRAIEPGAREMTIAGTAALPSGLYFGRLIAGADAAAAKLIVTR